MPQQRTIPRTCDVCGTPFLAERRKVNAGIARFCSVACRGAARRKSIERICEHCGKRFAAKACAVRDGKGRFCSRRCGAAKNGAAHNNWKGGRSVNAATGYVLVTAPDGRKALEHRLVMEVHLGRPLTPDEEVHHRRKGKEARSDNRLENLVLTTRHDHQRLYHSLKSMGKWSRDYDCCIECGRDDRAYGARGLCHTCYMRQRKHGACT